MRQAVLFAAAIGLIGLAPGPLHGNPYLAKPGEAPIPIRIATCALTGGFIHIYTALDNRLFDKYGFRVEHIFVRGGGVSMATLAAMASFSQTQDSRFLPKLI